MEFIEIIKCPACGKKEKIKFKKQYCPSCGCYLPPILKEKEEIYQHPYSYFPMQTQATPAQFNSYLNAQLQSAMQTLDSQVRQYEAQINQSIQSQIINQTQSCYAGRDEKGRLIRYTWTKPMG